jgi:hypothetical protein
MRYIRVDRHSLKVEVAAGKDARDKKRVFIPVKSDRFGSAPTSMLHYVVYFDVPYPIVETADRKRGIECRYSPHNETLTVAAMRVCNLDSLPARIHRWIGVRFYSSQSQVAASAAAASGKIWNTCSSRKFSKMSQMVPCNPASKNFPP